MKKNRFFREINVWEKLNEDRVAVFRCFEILPDGKYCVQSKDFFSVPVEEEAWRQSEEQFLELLSEMTPGRDSYDTLDQAIRRIDEDFAWAYSLERAGSFKEQGVPTEEAVLQVENGGGGKLADIEMVTTVYVQENKVVVINEDGSIVTTMLASRQKIMNCLESGRWVLGTTR